MDARVRLCLSMIGELPAMSELAKYSEVEALRDGRRVEIRALRPEDRDDLVAAVRRIGTDSLYRRFFAVKREFSEKKTSFFVNVDFVNHVALVAVAEEDERPDGPIGSSRLFQQNRPTADVGLSSAVAPRNHIQGRPAHFFSGRPRYANVGEEPVIKFEKLPALVLSFPPPCYSGQPRKRGFPGPSKVRKRG
jgi:hypothetical protein